MYKMSINIIPNTKGFCSACLWRYVTLFKFIESKAIKLKNYTTVKCISEISLQATQYLMYNIFKFARGVTTGTCFQTTIAVINRFIEDD